MDFLTALLAMQGFQLVLAGSMGGASRWIFVLLVDRKMAFMQGIGTIILGGILGFYVSPNIEGLATPLLSGFSTDPTRLPGFMAYATGVGGIGVVGFLIDWWNNRRKQPTGDQGVDPIPKPDNGDKQ